MANYGNAAITGATTGMAAGPWGALAGIGVGLASEYIKDKTGGYDRVREPEVDEAIMDTRRDRERILSRSATANMLTKQKFLQSGRSKVAGAAANIGSGIATRGAAGGGDVSSAQIQAVQASAPVAAATASYDNALSNTVTEKAAEEVQQNTDLAYNSINKANFSQMTDYREKRPFDLNNVLTNGMSLAGTASEFLGEGDSGQPGSTPSTQYTGIPTLAAQGPVKPELSAKQKLLYGFGNR
jgi:hypothetical protein